MKAGAEFHFPATVIFHHDGGTSRVKLLGVGSPSSGPDFPFWDIPTKCLPFSLRKIGSKIVVHYTAKHPEADDTLEQIRASRDMFIIRRLSEADEKKIETKPPAYWARLVDRPKNEMA